MLQSVDPDQAQGRKVLVKDVLDEAAQTIDKKFVNRPRIEATVRAALGQTYLALGDYEPADIHLSRAIELFREIGGEDDPHTISAQRDLARIRNRQGRFEEALALNQDTLDRCARIYGEKHPETAGATNDVAVILHRLGRRTEAVEQYRKALALDRELRGDEAPETLRTMTSLGKVLTDLGQADEAEQLIRDALEVRRRTLGDDHPDTIAGTVELAGMLMQSRRVPAAEPVMREGVLRSQRVLGADHPRTIFAQQGLAIILDTLGRYDEALPLYADALALARKRLGEDNIETFVIMSTAANGLTNAGRHAEAEPLLREALAGLSAQRGPNHPNTLSVKFNLVLTLQFLRKWEDSLPIAKDLYDALVDRSGSQIAPAVRAKFKTVYGATLTQLKQYDQAIPVLTTIESEMRSLNMVESPFYVQVVTNLATCTQAVEHPDAAKWAAASAKVNASTTRPTSKASQ
jgi:tetratricopeptide (TPR) repeat protein